MARLRDVAAFFIALAQEMSEMDMGDAMTNLRLQKMLYYAQGWSLARNGKPLFEEPIEAWHYGPVVPECYSWYCGNGRNPLTADMPEKESFSAEEYQLLLDTWAELSQYSTSQLVSMTHMPGTPWDKMWNVTKNREIPIYEINKYFQELPLGKITDKLASIPVVKPLYRNNGVPVFAAE